MREIHFPVGPDGKWMMWRATDGFIEVVVVTNDGKPLRAERRLTEHGVLILELLNDDDEVYARTIAVLPYR